MLLSVWVTFDCGGIGAGVGAGSRGAALLSWEEWAFVSSAFCRHCSAQCVLRSMCAREIFVLNHMQETPASLRIERRTEKFESTVFHHHR